ncbi:hypothetical protein NEOLEDRAFT_1126325 [Neolentinus lepideus HHB14362 ss-1]|uniref:Exocyst complex component Sec3 PIP2-binding N-terminal domain-containing protein n=1 Tax=Neolentinus lepideus HHB14362 ss-1 TaxID=1314782 RepID=A0A165W630_9AGAM|nr:hypothetical protein NEOLEDRAFT_1126325 [Neolentinus lepideus HHB14362 ss-1]
MADNDVVRERIISSVFARRNAAGTGPEESYTGHLRILEDAEDGSKKPRYIILSQTSNGTGFIHKSKLNTNGSFSVGKTWKIPELRAVEVLTPTSFNITLARTYRWDTENANDQANFLAALVKLFRSVTGGVALLDLIGLSDHDVTPGRQLVRSDYMRNTGSSTPPSAGASFGSVSGRRPFVQRSQPSSQDFIDPIPRMSSPDTRYQSRARRPSPLPSRPATPENVSALPTSPSRGIPSSPPRSQTPNSMRSRSRRASNATRTSDSTATQVPSISLPTTQSSIRSQMSRPSTKSASESTQGQTFLPSSSRPSLDVPSSTSSSFRQPSPTSSYGGNVDVTASQLGSTPSPMRSRQPSRGPSPSESQQNGQYQQRRDHNARISFFDPANQAALDRLLSAGETLPNTSSSGQEGAPVETEEETAQATMANVEEMLEGYEWASEDIMGRQRVRSAADQIEAKLSSELTALDNANIHSYIESDDRVAFVIKYLEEAIAELDNMDTLVSSYKIHLNTVSDDISYIQSQNRGLQVQTQNQRALLNELEQLLQTVHVDPESLITLTQESLEKAASIAKLEEAVTQLYKALQAGRDTDMAATMERLDEYRTHNGQFCKRIFDYLSIMFIAQSKMLLGDTDGIAKGTGQGKGRPTILNHQDMELYLGRYSGIILYLKEMDEKMYAKLCATYFSAASELHSKQVKTLCQSYQNMVKKAAEEEQEQTFAGVTPTSSGFRAGTGMRRAGTIVRSPLENRRGDRDKPAEADMRAAEAFGQVLEQIAPQIYREEDFIADFLQINDAALTFADYMSLENYFRRQAARYAGLSQSTTKLVRGALDLIFGFLPTEMKTWIDAALAKDNIQIIGIIATLERFQAEAEERGNAFLLNLLEKQHARLKGLFDRHVNEQIKAVEETKITSKKRRGVVPFIKYFPVYVGKVESQLIGADTLEIRGSVDLSYEKIVQVMFDSLKQMAKMEGEGEDKGQLNYHVILIENMHHFVAEMGQLEIGSVAVFLKRAESIYDENLNAYVKMILRRPLAKIIDYFEGVERLLRTTAPTEVSNNGSYNKSALKKIVKDYNAKDMRKHVDALFNRVEKHFTEASEKATTEKSTDIVPGTVMVGVWKACEEEVLRLTEMFSKRITQCYADSGVTLEYTAADVETAFRRHRVGN